MTLRSSAGESLAHEQECEHDGNPRDVSFCHTDSATAEISCLTATNFYFLFSTLLERAHLVLQRVHPIYITREMHDRPSSQCAAHAPSKYFTSCFTQLYINLLPLAHNADHSISLTACVVIYIIVQQPTDHVHPQSATQDSSIVHSKFKRP